ncbi:protein ARV1 [Orussus abietinus]|uniref:protein ARV1 n=1 Tax=Orussus abietinus TaxID=222816 RepID=UPI0006269B8A|nr:protein ARV1 [Orussus abietinus]XP_023287957.1 protein ARV1 [Orussus abietinus]XP_023287958.1 protein ARV1 [Orussus abietinus]
MYTCINCGTELGELYRRYSPSVLKVLKCEKCGALADKYIEYDPAIVLVDLVLLEKPAYRHLLYNSGFKSYWKLLIALLLGESFRIWYTVDSNDPESFAAHSMGHNDGFKREENFYVLLVHTALSLGAFVCTVIGMTEVRWLIMGRKPRKYKATDLGRALIVGGFAKLLGLLGIIWRHTSPDLHYALIHGYTVLCLLTAYSVVCESGRGGSLVGLTGGLLAHTYVSTNAVGLSPAIFNVSLT